MTRNAFFAFALTAIVTTVGATRAHASELSEEIKRIVVESSWIDPGARIAVPIVTYSTPATTYSDAKRPLIRYLRTEVEVGLNLAGQKVVERSDARLGQIVKERMQSVGKLGAFFESSEFDKTKFREVDYLLAVEFWEDGTKLKIVTTFYNIANDEKQPRSSTVSLSVIPARFLTTEQIQALDSERAEELSKVGPSTTAVVGTIALGIVTAAATGYALYEASQSDTLNAKAERTQDPAVQTSANAAADRSKTGRAVAIGSAIATTGFGVWLVLSW